MTRRLASGGRPATRRSVVVAALLLAACGAQPTLGTAPPARTPTPSAPRTAAWTRSASETPRATRTPGASAAPTLPIPLVVRHDDGSFSLIDAEGVRSMRMPLGDWWLAGDAGSNAVLLLPVEPGALDAAIVAVASDGTASVTRAIGDGSRLAGAGCVSSAGEVALAALDDSALELVAADGERRSIDFRGHGSLGECAWLSPDALVTPATHDHSLLYFHRTGRGQGHAEHAGAFPGVTGRYPTAGGERLAMTTGDAGNEALTLWHVGEIEGDGSTPPALSTAATFRPGDGPRRGVHALSPDGRLIAAAGTDDGQPALWLYDVREPGQAPVTVALSRPADRVAFLAPPEP